MKKIDMSKFKIYSIGRVADNKSRSSKTINVLPIEKTSMLSGEIASNPQTMSAKGVDAEGKHQESSVTTDNVIEAEWLPFGSNRVTAPDVRRGERVLVWQYADVDGYYWTSTGWDDVMRRLETVVYAWSNVSTTDNKEFNPKDYYFVEISTHDKHVIFRTSKADGEPFEYGFVFNTKDGIVTLADDLGNKFELNSKTPSFLLELATGPKIEMNRLDIFMEALKTFTLKCGPTEHVMNMKGWTVKTTNWNLTASKIKFSKGG